MSDKITYRQVGDYRIPNLILPEEEKDIHIGIWGMRRKKYLMNNNRVLFSIMLADSTLWNHLAEIDKQAEEMFFLLINEMARAEGVSENQKVKDQMAWVGAMNNIRQRATEIINNEIIYV